MKTQLEVLQLQQFLAVARAKSFSRAAEELNLSQPTLSRAVLKLEQMIGQPLFERKPREVVLTDLGELLFDRADRIITQIDDLFVEISEASQKGRIRLAVIPTIAPYLLPDVLDDFSKAYPNVSVLVQEDTTGNIVTMCKHGEVDLAILALPLSIKYLQVEPLFEEELVLVVPKGHALEKKRSIHLNDVQQYPFLMLGQAHCLSENIAAFCRQESIEPVSISRTSQLATVQELVALNHGISMVPKMAQRLDTSKRRVYRSFTGSKPTRTIAMLTNPYRYESKWLKAFKDHLRKLKPAK
jgi:LysR family transcriptional regulator, hydrogen peroxide-inducible genes activator